MLIRYRHALWHRCSKSRRVRDRDAEKTLVYLIYLGLANVGMAESASDH